ncbi:hypothetical protein [Gloeobacter kilaueensis]|nr:hypothetical protein [Gloeobacter kilaueensis]
MVGISPDSGASTFADPTVPGLSGHYWRLPDSTNLAPDLAVIPDGTDNGGIHSPTHHTIYPCVKMLPVDFIAKFSNLPWEYVGKMP